MTMASVFRRGKRPNFTYWVSFHERGGKRRLSFCGGPDRVTADVLCQQIERLERLRLSDEPLDAAMIRWVEGLPDKWRVKLVDADLLDGPKAGAMKPLVDHVADYRADLMTTATEAHADQVSKRLLHVFELGGMKAWSDLTPERVRAALDKMRVARNPIKIQTKNNHIAGVKAFANWMVNDDRADSSPVAGRKLTKMRITDAAKWRAPSINELRRIITAAANGSDYRWGGGRGRNIHQPRCITGEERALLYMLASVSGLRASELAALTRGDFQLDTLPYCVELAGMFTKNDRAATVPLTDATANRLRHYFAYRLGVEDEPVFAIPMSKTGKPQVSRMIQRDAKAAGVDYETKEGILNFHSLRHGFVSGLFAAGASSATVRDLSRHSSLSVTDRYAHTDDTDKQAAIAAMPDLTPMDEVAQATGTNDSPVVNESTDGQTGAQHSAQHARNIPVRQASSSFVMDERDEQDDDECKPLQTPEKCADVRQDSSSFASIRGRARTCNLRLRRPTLYPIELRGPGRRIL